MSTATIEGPLLVQQPDKQILFLSKRSELRLVHTARWPKIQQNTGQRLGESRGVVVPFIDNEFRCPVDGDVTFMDPGGAGQATMPAKDLLDFLRGHPRFGDPNEGFMEVHPSAPPLGRDEQERIVRAATEWDVETLQAVLEQERAGWEREDVLALVQGAVERIEAAEARIRADEQAKKK